MQHPDEGTIHSWLDGALLVEEAARVESHVTECLQCATAVAEARGFIAASSRILTALDDVPRGVVPVAPARKRDLRVFWRAAAAMLVVAGGSLAVLRETGQDARVTGSAKEAVPFESKTLSATKDAPVAEGIGVAAPQSDTGPSSQRQAAPPTARAGKAAASAERDLSVGTLSGRVSGTAGGATGQAVVADAAAPTNAVVQLSANTASESSEVAPLKVLRVERTIGGRRTIYEVAPTQTVTLTEPELLLLSGVVTTGVATVQERQSRASGARSAEPMRAAAAAAPQPVAPLTDSRRAADSVTLSREAAPIAKTLAPRAQAGAAFIAPVNTISWTEAATGKTLTLSGNLPVERLQEIRRQIERERAASSKKDP